MAALFIRLLNFVPCLMCVCIWFHRKSLALPDSICDELKKRGVRFSFHQTLEEVIPKVDILIYDAHSARTL